MVFRPPFALNNEHWGNFKGVPPVGRSLKGAVVSVTAPMQSGGQLRHLPCCDIPIVSVADANTQWGRFVSPSCSQKRENTAFELVLRSDWRLSSTGKQVDRSSIPCRKRSQVWGRGSERWPKYMQQRHQCWKWEEF